MVQAGSYSSDLTASLETSVCCGCSSEKMKDKKKIIRNLKAVIAEHSVKEWVLLRVGHWVMVHTVNL